MFAFEVIGFTEPFTLVATVVLVAPVAPLTWVVVVVDVVVFAFELITVEFMLLLLAAELLAAPSPQAMPNPPKAKRVESAIIFFISKWTLLSFSKNILTYFYLLPPLQAALPQNVKFWNNRQYSHPVYISQLLKQGKKAF